MKKTNLDAGGARVQAENMPPHWQPLAAGLDRLADRLLSGEVVFFVGAGFSFDSEGNSTKRLLGRLLARFEGIAGTLTDPDSPLQALNSDERLTWSTDNVQREAHNLRKALRRTFSFKNPDDSNLLPVDELPSGDHLDALSGQYYAFNDWITSAYGQLLLLCTACSNYLLLAQRINRLENDVLRIFKDNVPLAQLDLERIVGLEFGLARAAWGKILFLETLGFNELRIMGGCPFNQDLLAAERSFRDRLLPRHKVLARLAREGLCPTLLTTNYDLLLEGAYRLAGFSSPQIVDPEADCPPLSLASYPHMIRVGEARHFFEHARTQRAAQVIKIHGCADRYRQVRDDPKYWQGYLPSIVFTFREIQNWRKDSWSRDLVSTLLRTRTLVFCGYSAADPVLHDTIRTVYEEMSSTLASTSSSANVEREELTKKCEGAPAFAFGGAEHREFHVLEVLRAASRAIGVSEPPLYDHPNYLPFYFWPRKPGDRATSPNLDQALLWLHHRVQRKLQVRHLRRELSSLLPTLLRHPAPAAEMKAVQDAFHDVCQAEHLATASWGERLPSAFSRIISWTWNFHPALLRELACSEAAVRRVGPGLHLQNLRRRPWIFPTTDRPEWSAWGVVIELALRRLTAQWWKPPMEPKGRTESRLWTADSPMLRPESGLCPSLILVPNLQQPTPIRLELRLAGQGRDRFAAGAVAARRSWLLPPGHLPWPIQGYGDTPSPETLWRWACGRFGKDEAENELNSWLRRPPLSSEQRASQEKAHG